MIEITCNDRLGKKVRVKCNPDDTIGDLKKLIAAQTGTRSDKIVLKKCARFCLCINDTTESYENAFIGTPGMVCCNPLTVGNQQFKYTIFKDNITLEDYEIHDGMNLELYYQ